MKTALIKSTKIEIDASYFDKHPGSAIRLICPECNEPVMYVDGEIKHGFFKHWPSTYDTPPCSKRNSVLSSGNVEYVSKETTTPIYLRGNEKFSLTAVFKPIPPEFENIDRFTITIGKIYAQVFYLQRFRNSSKEIKLKVPPIGDESKIRIDGYNAFKDDIVRLWGSHLDNINKNGAFFNYNNRKLVKRGWELYKESKYLLITKDPDSIPFQYEHLGTVLDMDYDVFSIEIPGDLSEDMYDFVAKFGVSIGSRDQIPDVVWPPITMNYEQYNELITDSDIIICKKTRETEVWGDESSVIASEGNLLIIKSKDRHLNISDDDWAHSIDLQNYSSESRKIIDNNAFEFVDMDNKKVEYGNNSYKIISNFDGFIAEYDSTGCCITTEIRDSITNLNSKQKIEVYSRYLKQAEIISKNQKNPIQSIDFNRNILLNENMIQAPAWTRTAIINLGKNDSSLARIIFSSIKNGMIPRKICDFLTGWR